MKKNEVKVFVYGTLKRGHSLHDFYMGNSIFVDSALVHGVLYEFHGLPILFHGDSLVSGEIYLMPEKDFAAVRAMEEASGYQTELTELYSQEDGKCVDDAMVFFASADCPFPDAKKVKKLSSQFVNWAE